MENMYNAAVQILVLLVLAVNSWIDIKKREISLVSVGCLAVLGTAANLIQQVDMSERWISLGIGCMGLAFSICSRGSFGMGDAWMLLAVGLSVEEEIFLEMLCLGMLLAAAFASCLLIFTKKNRRWAFPFLPFLLIGYVGGLWICGQ